MPKKNEFDFFKLSAEEQAKQIEKETKKLLERLPELKKKLKMYNEVSSELYNLEPEEVELIGSSYAQAVRSGEITTPTSKQAYNKFIKDLRRYTRRSIADIAKEVAERRLDSWLDTIKEHASQAEIDYVTSLLNEMTDEQKQGFTRSQYFVDNVNWVSDSSFVIDTNEGEFSIQALELELYLESHTDISTRSVYNRLVATDGKMKKRRGYGRAKSRKRR